MVLTHIMEGERKRRAIDFADDDEAEAFQRQWAGVVDAPYIPYEVWYHILLNYNLTPRAIRTLCRVSPDFRTLCDDPVLWKTLIKRRFGLGVIQRAFPDVEDMGYNYFLALQLEEQLNQNQQVYLAFPDAKDKTRDVWLDYERNYTLIIGFNNMVDGTYKLTPHPLFVAYILPHLPKYVTLPYGTKAIRVTDEAERQMETLRLLVRMLQLGYQPDTKSINIDSCIGCTSSTIATVQCLGCGIAKYCHESCAQTHWQSVHQYQCKK